MRQGSSWHRRLEVGSPAASGPSWPGVMWVLVREAERQSCVSGFCAPAGHFRSACEKVCRVQEASER